LCQSRHLNKRNQNRDTTLHIAINSQLSLKKIRFLISKTHNYISLNCQNNQGNTPLHLAIYQLDYYVVQYLIFCGVKITTPSNDQGLSPIQLAQQINDPQLLSLFVRAF